MIHKLYPGIHSRYTLEEFKDKFRNIDLIIIDLDKCLFPGYSSQITMGRLMLLDTILHAYNVRYRKHLPQLISGGVFVLRVSLKTIFRIITPNLTLIRKYEQTMKGIPKQYFHNLAKRILAMSDPLALDTVRELSKKAAVGIISLGINTILEEYLYQWHPHLTFFDANEIEFEKNKGEEVFKSYNPGNLKTNGTHKRQMLEKRLKEFGAGCPLVIGNDENDIEMGKLAQERGGMGIGINVSARVEDTFDVRVKAKSWEPLYKLIKDIQ